MRTKKWEALLLLIATTCRLPATLPVGPSSFVLRSSALAAVFASASGADVEACFDVDPSTVSEGPPLPPSEPQLSDVGLGSAEGGAANEADDVRSRPRPPHPRHDEYASAVSRAIRWIDKLDVDPPALQKVGVKGKKKLGEAMAVYELAMQYEDDLRVLVRLRDRFSYLVMKTRGAEYHNLGSCDDVEFKQNSMSYLRVLRLMEKGGFDVSEYRVELNKVKRRMDAHMLQRGPWQQAMFAKYYDEFGLDKPPILRKFDSKATSAAGGVSKRRRAQDIKGMDGYEITHEVFVAYDYGFAADQETFSHDDITYLLNTLPELIIQQMKSGNPGATDLLGEYVTCMVFLGGRDHLVTARAIDHLLDKQNSDGSWGKYGDMEISHGKYATDHRVYLHNTHVVLQALHEYFRRP